MVDETRRPATRPPGGRRIAGDELSCRSCPVAARLLLSAFPILAVFAAAASSRLRRRTSGTVAIGAAALLVSLVMTTVYHLGYSDFRSSLLARPVTADLAWSVPTGTVALAESVLVQAGPVGSSDVVHLGGCPGGGWSEGSGLVKGRVRPVAIVMARNSGDSGSSAGGGMRALSTRIGIARMLRFSAVSISSTPSL